MERATWVEGLNFQYLLGVDGISIWLVLLTTFLMPVAVLASWGVERRVTYFMAAFLLLESAMLGAFVAWTCCCSSSSSRACCSPCT